MCNRIFLRGRQSGKQCQKEGGCSMFQNTRIIKKDSYFKNALTVPLFLSIQVKHLTRRKERERLEKKQFQRGNLYHSSKRMNRSWWTAPRPVMLFRVHHIPRNDTGCGKRPNITRLGEAFQVSMCSVAVLCLKMLVIFSSSLWHRVRQPNACCHPKRCTILHCTSWEHYISNLYNSCRGLDTSGPLHNFTVQHRTWPSVPWKQLQ